MRRFFAQNLLFLLAVNLLVKPAWVFLIDRNVQLLVGYESFGRYQALVNLGLIFQILLDLGITNYNSRTLSQFPGKRNRIFPAMFTARILLGGLYLLVVSGVALLLGYRNEEIYLLGGILLIQMLTAMMMFIRSTFAGLHLFRADGILSVSDRLLLIAGCGLLLLLPATARQFTIWWFVLAQIISLGLSVTAGLFLLRKKTQTAFYFSFNASRIWKVIKDSLPYAVLVFLMFTYTRSDTLLIDLMSDARTKDQAGVYAAAYRLLDVCNMFGLLFTSMLLPVFGKMLGQKASVLPVLQLCTRILIPLSLLAAIAAWCFQKEVMQWLYATMPPADYMAFAVLMLGFPAISISNIYSALLTAGGYLKIQCYAALTGVLVNMILNFWLIPQYAALGAAASALMTQAWMAVCFSAIAVYKYRLPVLTRNTGSLVAFLVFSLVMAGVCLQVPAHWMLQLSCFIASGGLGMFFFRFVTPGALKMLFAGKS